MALVDPKATWFKKWLVSTVFLSKYGPCIHTVALLAQLEHLCPIHYMALVDPKATWFKKWLVSTVCLQGCHLPKFSAG